MDDIELKGVSPMYETDVVSQHKLFWERNNSELERRRIYK